MTSKRFDVKKLAKLNNPQRLKDVPIDFLIDKVQPTDTGTMVDIGAGTAFFSIAFLEKVECETLYCCDVSETMIEWMEENAVPANSALRPVKTEGNSIPLDDTLVGMAFMINLYHELDDHHEMLAETYRVLKPGGKVLIVDWKKEEMADGPPLTIRHRTESVEEDLEMTGFSAIGSSEQLGKHFVVWGTK